MRKSLEEIYVLQTKTINKDDRFQIRNLRRINPYNPISYITLVIIFITALILFGIIGMWEEIESKNPFKWN